MNLTRPIVFLDIESACPGPYPDPAKDKIVTLALKKIANGYPPEMVHYAFNPGFEMRPENIECHGITNEMAMEWPLLDNAAAQSIAINLGGCDLAGFNLVNYDVPLLWEELMRFGVELSLNGVAIVDAGTIFKLKEERSLSAAVKFYCDRDHKGAHDAMNDVDETIAVLEAQLKRYPDLAKMTIAELAKFSAYDERVDLAGKIIKGPDGVPVYNVGKARGVKVVDDPGFGYWMLSKDFPQFTKRVLRKLLNPQDNQNDLF